MELHRFLSLLATLIGLIGAAFVAKGIVILSPEEMIRSTTHYSAIAWPSKRIITSISTDQADTLVGFIFVFLACLIQAVAIFVNEEGLEDMIGEYLPELERKDSGSQKDFIKRIADYASCILPNNTDFSKLEESRLKR